MSGSTIHDLPDTPISDRESLVGLVSRFASPHRNGNVANALRSACGVDPVYVTEDSDSEPYSNGNGSDHA